MFKPSIIVIAVTSQTTYANLYKWLVSSISITNSIILQENKMHGMKKLFINVMIYIESIQAVHL